MRDYKKERARLLEKNPNYYKDKYRRELELHPNHNKDKYDKALFMNPNRNKCKMRFRGKRIELCFNPYFDSCVKCKRTISSGEIKQTQLHHDLYDMRDPLAYTRELCVKCHREYHANGMIVPILIHLSY